MKDRYLHRCITEDLKEKMAFIAGPRQVGKTTLARFIGKKEYPKTLYLNWDYRENRKEIMEARFSADAKLIIFDELHKYKGWKSYIKGVFDQYKDNFKILVTGSARLDLYRKGGDSLMGRYHAYRLHPFSVAELLTLSLHQKPFKTLEFTENNKRNWQAFESIRKYGGFPEPLLKQNEKTLRRWQNERMDRLIREDIRDIELLRDLSALQILVDILPEKVGSRFSLNSLREDLQVSHKTIAHWVDVLERFYYHFRIYPFAARRIASLRKEPKLYLWDWSQLTHSSARFENILASHLLKTVHFLYDSQGYRTDLHYLRDTEGREVDFLVTVNKKPWFAVEVKESSKEPSQPLLYFRRKLEIPFCYQVINEPDIDFIQDHVRIISADKFLTAFV